MTGLMSFSVSAMSTTSTSISDRSPSFQQMMSEIQNMQEQTDKNLKALESAASVEPPAYIKNGQPNPRAYTSTDTATGANSTIEIVSDATQEDIGTSESIQVTQEAEDTDNQDIEAKQPASTRLSLPTPPSPIKVGNAPSKAPHIIPAPSKAYEAKSTTAKINKVASSKTIAATPVVESAEPVMVTRNDLYSNTTTPEQNNLTNITYTNKVPLISDSQLAKWNKIVSPEDLNTFELTINDQKVKIFVPKTANSYTMSSASSNRHYVDKGNTINESIATSTIKSTATINGQNLAISTQIMTPTKKAAILKGASASAINHENAAALFPYNESIDGIKSDQTLEVVQNNVQATLIKSGFIPNIKGQGSHPYALALTPIENGSILTQVESTDKTGLELVKAVAYVITQTSATK